MLSTLWSICSSVLTVSDSRLKYALIGLLVGSVVSGCSVHYVWSLRSDRQEAQQQKAVAAQTAAAQTAERATKVIQERYDETVKTAAAVAVSHADMLDGLRKQLAAAKKRPAASCSNEVARFHRAADAAVRCADLCVECSDKLTNVEAQLKALQDWVRVNH